MGAINLREKRDVMTDENVSVKRRGKGQSEMQQKRRMMSPLPFLSRRKRIMISPSSLPLILKVDKHKLPVHTGHEWIHVLVLVCGKLTQN
jgi:hypothetical protein